MISLMHEEALYQEGYTHIGGVDEVGRGPLAGPVVAAAVIMPRGLMIEGVNDSKKLTPKRREALAGLIREAAVSYGIGLVEVETIDRINILQATLLAMNRAIDALCVKPDALMIDGVHLPSRNDDIKYIGLPHGDALSHSIAAASIIAKVTRDAMMEDLHRQYPVYGFNQNKGYGTAAHINAIRTHGLSPHHRVSFKVRGLSVLPE